MGLGRLAIMARPRANDWLADEVAAWRAEGVDVVVGLLAAEEVAELGLADEPALCRGQGIEFLSFPVQDRGVPALPLACRLLIDELSQRLRGARSVAIHCRAGIGRSALIAAFVMRTLGVEADASFRLISAARGVRVPDTDSQMEWVKNLRLDQPI